MNLSNIITRVKLKLGLINIALPFENMDQVITTIIQEITIPVFSQYNPVPDRLVCDTNDLEKIEKRETYETYLLPDFKNRKLLYVFDVNYDDSCLSGLGYFGGGVPLIAGNTINQAMLANAGASLMSTLLPKVTFLYEPPRKLRLYNMYYSAKVVISLGFEHDKSLASIPETARESFMQLLLLDVKENLYPTLKQYSQINSAIGNIDLKIDDWANAEQERRELLNQWDDTYHLDIGPSMYYI